MSQQVHPKGKLFDAWFITVQLWNDWINVACLGTFPGQMLLSVKIMWQCSLGWTTCIWIKYKTLGTIFFGQMRPKWRYLVMLTPYIHCQTWWWKGDDLGMFLQPQNRGNFHLLSTQCDDFCIPRYKYTTKSTTQWYEKVTEVLQWPCQGSDINLWQALRWVML